MGKGGREMKGGGGEKGEKKKRVGRWRMGKEGQ